VTNAVAASRSMERGFPVLSGAQDSDVRVLWRRWRC
jgi:hypothetical protein